MRYVRIWFAAALACILLAASWGCSEKPSVTGSSAEGEVSGVVNIRGKPMAGGELSFDPANYQRPNEKPRKATVGPDGTYSVTTLVGHNSVRISGPAITKEPALAYGIHNIEVTSGPNTFNIDLPPK
jgi:hypothetical protein